MAKFKSNILADRLEKIEREVQDMLVDLEFALQPVIETDKGVLEPQHTEFFVALRNLKDGARSMVRHERNARDPNYVPF